MKTMLRVTVILGVAISLLPGEAHAIPALARKYQTSCMTCHEMFPRLNAFGEAVRLNGMRWPDAASSIEKDKEVRKDEPVPMGADAYKKVFPDAVWPVDIPGWVPLSFRNNTIFRKTLEPGGRNLEWEWELATAGTIGDNMSFFGHANFVTDSGLAATVKEDVHLIAHLNLENIVGPAHLVNVQIGTVAVEEANYFHYRSHSTNSLLPPPARTFARLDTLPYPTGFANPDLFKLRRGPGAMLWGFTSRSSWSLGYRIGDQNGGGTDMNVGFFHWAYKIGGMDHVGRTQRHFAQSYMENSLSFGVLGDLGSVGVKASANDPTTQDTFWRAGGDLRLKVGAWAYRAGVITGAHSTPYGALDSSSVQYTTWFNQTEYHWFPWLLTEVRYEEDYFGVPAALNLGNTNRARFVPSISALYGANVRFNLWGELYTKYRTDATGRKLDPSAFGFLLDFAI